MCDANSIDLHKTLSEKGHINAWRAQVMADILLPYLKNLVDNECRQNIEKLQGNPTTKLSLMIVKEFLRNLGLPSTEKIFEVEAGLTGKDCEYDDLINNSFTVIKPTDQVLRPPILAQLIFIFGLENQLDFSCELAASAGSSESECPASSSC